ncbi:MAG TPA: glycosyltransferase family 2 protein [Gemmataceae bacterium]|nr:glycosyltransferase family 2 protein [Gemmataceae bacterium]
MDQAKLAKALLAELRSNEQAVQSLETETKAIAHTLRKTRAAAARARRSPAAPGMESVPELTEQLNWMTRLLKVLKAEKEPVEQDLRLRLASLRKHLGSATISPPPPEEALRERSASVVTSHPLRKRVLHLSLRGARVLKNEGALPFLIKTARRVYRKLDACRPSFSLSRRRRLALAACPHIFRMAGDGLDAEYAEWIKRNEPTLVDLIQQRQTIFPIQPRISVVVPAYNTPVPFLLAMIESVRAQTYPHWELCIADGGSQNQLAKAMLRDYAQNDSRIKVTFLSENQGIVGNSNQAMALATGDFLALLDHDDTLSPFALFEVASAINRHPDADFLYSDEDKIGVGGHERFCPHFKPGWAPDTLRSINYITHMSVFGRRLMDKIGGFRAGFDGSQDYDLILRATEQARQIVHIPKVLYHWRSHPESVAGGIEAKMYAFEAAKKALREHLARCSIDAEVQSARCLGTYRIAHHLPRRPLVSIVIPSKDHPEILRCCLDSIARSTYKNYEIVVVENNSQDPRTFAYYAEAQKRPEVRVVPWNQPFNYAAAVNFGVRQSRGEILLFLNNDMEVINEDWLERLLEYALRGDVGAIGAKLYYPNGIIQHGGVVIGLGGIAGHCGLFLEGANAGYMARLLTVQNLSAVTGACLMTPRHAFEEVGGLDERFVLAFNDIDYCLRLRERGHLVVWTPYAELYHYESLTRGPEDTPEKQARFHAEIRLFTEKWNELLEAGDPYYSPNATLSGHDWSVRMDEARPQQPRTVATQRLPTAAA